MAITKEEKREYATKFGKKENDTGSAQVQIAILTHRIRELTEHLKIHKKDNHTRLGLLKLVGKRRRLLKYLESSQISDYRSLIKKLNIRK